MKIVGWLGAHKLASAYRVLWKARRSEPISGTILYKYKFGIDTSQGVRTQVTPEMSKYFCHNVRTLAVPGDNWDADYFRPFTQGRHV